MANNSMTRNGGERVPRFQDAWLDELRARCDIVDVVSEYVHLQPKGRRYWGLCPFHNEKTPSFSVNADAQTYYCFGCHAGGNVFHFVMATERMPFAEAVIHLAERAHMPVPDAPAGTSREERERLMAALTSAARWYRDRLFAREGEEAMAYLRRRGLTEGTIRKFGLGATGPGWDGLTEALMREGFAPEELQKAGLTILKEGKRYDAFRGRAMFPIFDAQGRVIAFGGRILGDGQPKYLNSSDTPVFNKRFHLYALNFVKKLRDLRELLLVEGYMDVVSLAQAGVQGAVATLGTSITADQARLMKRYAPTVTVCYDGDEPGQKAIAKALDLLEEAGAAPKVLRLPDGMDPDDVVRREGKEGFDALPRTDATTWRLARAAVGIDLSGQEGRTQYAIDASRILRRLHNPVQIEEHLGRLSVQTGFPREVLRQQVGQMALVNISASEHTDGKNRHNNSDRGEFLPDHLKGERQLLALMAKGLQLPPGIVGADDFTDPLHARLAALILQGGAAAAARGMDDWAEEERSLAAQILSTDPLCSPDQIPAHMRQIAVTMRIATLDKELAQTRERLMASDAAPQEQMALAQRKVAIDMERLRLLRLRKTALMLEGRE